MAIGGRLKITGVDKIRLELSRRSASARSYRATVGYYAPYAVRIHEDLAMNHPNGGQAKFLEEPARTMQRQMGRIVEKHLKRKNGKLYDGVLESAKFLYDESQKLVPVDTGFLRLSGYYKVSSHETTQWSE